MKTIESNPGLTHEAVFEWCIQSASSMLKAMPTPRHQKNFVRKLSDQAQSATQNLLGDLQAGKQAEWDALKHTSDEFIRA
mmetsp:Transcript_36877/g.48452  ORF Transcript_36877/g.48452 Transcript_36877/m.48452 type:complete len:80 (+) Transcript_36877:584-823(+)|eukprot:CAMPEP_0170466794 /NCGR_PEP_ID=MMETSP0123-20130129/10612_1 /TAXON_ID=182087 /ORGANISM="Favella ehrenbergii, Strain Fehren 1" /LENGTH=79 /DNA_ID=CAMNT_0010732995 /DNA_START=484 /DNA_END=723 /DNA_ORIENTATION=+